MFADHTRGVDMVIRYENIEADLTEVFRKAGMGSRADIPVVNRTDERADSDYRPFYSRVAASSGNACVFWRSTDVRL